MYFPSDDLWAGNLVLNSNNDNFSDMVWSKVKFSSLVNPVGRAHHASTSVMAALFIHGGCGADQAPIFADVWKFIPSSSSWILILPVSQSGTIPVGRYGHNWGTLFYSLSVTLSLTNFPVNVLFLHVKLLF